MTVMLDRLREIGARRVARLVAAVADGEDRDADAILLEVMASSAATMTGRVTGGSSQFSLPPRHSFFQKGASVLSCSTSSSRASERSAAVRSGGCREQDRFARFHRTETVDNCRRGQPMPIDQVIDEGRNLLLGEARHNDRASGLRRRRLRERCRRSSRPRLRLPSRGTARNSSDTSSGSLMIRIIRRSSAEGTRSRRPATVRRRHEPAFD